MPEPETLSYDVVTRVRRREKDASPLQRLDPPDFYGVFRATVETYQVSIREAKDAGDEERLSLLRNDLKRITQRVREIYALREKKIAELAALKAGGGDPDVGALAKEERPLFESFLLVMTDHRGAMLEFKEPALPSYRPGRAKAEPSAERAEGAADAAGAGTHAGEPADQAREEEAPSKAPPANVQRLEETPVAAPPDKVVLLAVKDLPPFSGVHRDYHVRKGDVFSVPRKRAEALVRMGAVVQVGS